MRTETCQCGQTLFFDNTRCMRCQLQVGWCDACWRMATLVPTIDGGWQCHHANCKAKLMLCENYKTANVCNWTISETPEAVYCASCELTELIPNLSEPEHHERWYQLEMAKRRLLYSLNLLGFPFRRSNPRANPPLRFRFLDPAGSDAPVTTGHANGCITISLVEADQVEREKTRIAFDEPQRTLVGHFRHEIGHYYWDVLVAGRQEGVFRDVFGDERSPSYQEAQTRYYEQGPLPDWERAYISTYASMHPWEDFAESFAGYLDMISLLDTAAAHQLIAQSAGNFSEMILTYQQWAVVLNEISRERGLLDLVPEILTKSVVEKLQFIHHLVEPETDRSKNQIG